MLRGQQVVASATRRVQVSRWESEGRLQFKNISADGFEITIGKVKLQGTLPIDEELYAKLVLLLNAGVDRDG